MLLIDDHDDHDNNNNDYQVPLIFVTFYMNGSNFCVCVFFLEGVWIRKIILVLKFFKFFFFFCFQQKKESKIFNLNIILLRHPNINTANGTVFHLIVFFFTVVVVVDFWQVVVVCILFHSFKLLDHHHHWSIDWLIDKIHQQLLNNNNNNNNKLNDSVFVCLENIYLNQLNVQTNSSSHNKIF